MPPGSHSAAAVPLPAAGMNKSAGRQSAAARWLPGKVTCTASAQTEGESEARPLLDGCTRISPPEGDRPLLDGYLS